MVFLPFSSFLYLSKIRNDWNKKGPEKLCLTNNLKLKTNTVNMLCFQFQNFGPESLLSLLLETLGFPLGTCVDTLVFPRYHMYPLSTLHLFPLSLLFVSFSFSCFLPLSLQHPMKKKEKHGNNEKFKCLISYHHFQCLLSSVPIPPFASSISHTTTNLRHQRLLLYQACSNMMKKYLKARKVTPRLFDFIVFDGFDFLQDNQCLLLLHSFYFTFLVILFCFFSATSKRLGTLKEAT